MEHEKKKKMKKCPCNKGLLLPWLRTALNNEWYEGLRWKDKQKGIFYVHWTHKSAEQWSLSEIEVCQAWAAHKGKLGNKNSKQLKATFRCALNSKKELQELKKERTKRLRYWQFIDPSNSVELKDNKKIGKLTIETPGTSADNTCDRMSPNVVNFSNEDLRIVSSPLPEQNRLTPPADNLSSVYQHSSTISTFQETSTDVWQPNFMSIPNGHQVFLTFNEFSQQLDELIKPMAKQLLSNSSMSDIPEINQDQFVPVMYNYSNSPVPVEQFGCVDKTDSSNTICDISKLDEDYMLYLDDGPIDCEKFIQEFNMLNSTFT